MTVAIKEDVGWFKVSMDDFCAMKEFYPFDDLVDDEPVMDVFEDFLTYGIMKISLHKLKNKIKILIIFSLDNIMKLNYIRMVKLMQEYNLPKSTLSISGMLESIKYFLQGKSLVAFFIGDFPNMTVCSTTEFFNQGVFA